MHNKYTVIDRTIVMTGSYNWTNKASTANQENVVVLENKPLANKFAEHFDRIWNDYSKNKVKASKAFKKTGLYNKMQKKHTSKMIMLLAGSN